MKYQSASQQNNFDLIRLLLAFAVFLVHAAVVTDLPVFVTIATFLNSKFAVYSFFIVSGFLIFMSFENSRSISSFFKKRFLRIYPGYAFVIVLVSIAAVGISESSVADYFSYDWLKYFVVNMLTLNFIQPTLPGVFVDNSLQAVNAALWTIKVEVMFYAAVPIVGLLLKKYPTFAVLMLVYVLSIIYYELLMHMAATSESGIYALLAKQLPGQLSFFIAGALLYYYFEHFKKFALPYLLLSLFCIVLYTNYDIWFFFPFALGFVVIYLATMFAYLGNFGKYGDFSFGIYIWHFPIVQTFVHFNLFSIAPVLGSIALVLTVLLFSVLSWKFIEKPFLRKKSHYILAEEDKK